MPLRALVDGRELQVWNLTGEPWQALKRRSRTAAAALRLACGAPAIARPAAAATRSSPTIPRAARSRPAAGPPRAPFHAGCKLLAASSARAAGWQVRTEAAAADGSWRADVLCRRGACRVALEIQLARTGPEDLRFRQERYRRADIRAVPGARRSTSSAKAGRAGEGRGQDPDGTNQVPRIPARR